MIASNSPLVSIVTPSYQSAHFIEETIKSIRNQTYSNIEYIIVDGGSTDGTVDIIHRYRNVVTKFISEVDHGQADAIRKGFDLAKGDILSWINSDDVLEPDSIENVVNSLSVNDADVVYGNMTLIDTDGTKIGERFTCPLPRPGRLHGFIHGTLGLYQPAAFWTNELYRKSGGVNTTFQFAMDTDLFIKFVALGARFEYVDKFFAQFRVHENSKTSTLKDIALKDMKTISRSWPQKHWVSILALKTYNRIWKLSYHIWKGRFRYLVIRYTSKKYRFVP